MDNNNKKNSFPGDLDNMRLKDHLNASFELDNIKVSEDLIARALKAVKEAEVQAEHPEEMNKIKRFPVRRLVSAAAVVLVLLVGIQVMRNSSIGSKKDAGSSENLSTEMAADNGMAQTYGIPETTMDVTGSTESGTTAFDAAEADEAKTSTDTSASAEEAENQYTAETPGNITKTAGEGTGLYDGELIFSAAIPVAADSITALTITKNNGSQVSLKKVAENASKLYGILDGYSLTLQDGTIKEDNSDWTYKVLITTKDKLDYTILIGKIIQIQNTTEQAKNTTEYLPGDVNALLRELDDFYNSVR